VKFLQNLYYDFFATCIKRNDLNFSVISFSCWLCKFVN